jgi:hypothetical protein
LVSLEVKMETCRHWNEHQFIERNFAVVGSCPFRSLALLLENDETKYTKLRERTWRRYVIIGMISTSL